MQSNLENGSFWWKQWTQKISSNAIKWFKTSFSFILHNTREALFYFVKVQNNFYALKAWNNDPFQEVFFSSVRDSGKKRKSTEDLLHDKTFLVHFDYHLPPLINSMNFAKAMQPLPLMLSEEWTLNTEKSILTTILYK